MKFIKLSLITLGLYTLVSAPVHANNAGPYFAAGMADVLIRASDTSFKGNDTGYRFIVGVRFNRLVAAELTHTNARMTDGNRRGNGSLSTFDLLLGWPIKEIVEPHVRLGYGSAKASVKSTYYSHSFSDQATSYGAGVGVNLNRNLQIRAGYSTLVFANNTKPRVTELMAVLKF